jgi:hypothetical protein
VAAGTNNAGALADEADHLIFIRPFHDLDITSTLVHGLGYFIFG